jgi:uncharacterized membrane protein YfcA
VSLVLALAACGLLVAATVQSATGFGFSLVAGPALYAVVEPAAALGLIMVIAQIVNMLVLFGERRRPQVEWSAVRPALLAALPGLPIGALLVRTLPESALRIGIGLVVCAIIVHRLARRLRRQQHAAAARATVAGDAASGPGGALVTGLTVGVLTTSTTTSGPPLAIWLTARRIAPATIRDTVTVIFFVLDLVGIAVVIAVVGAGASLARAEWIPLLIPVALAGHLLGRQVFVRLPVRHYDLIVLGLALVAGAVSIATGIA